MKGEEYFIIRKVLVYGELKKLVQFMQPLRNQVRKMG